jgi:hypothetical protein
MTNKSPELNNNSPESDVNKRETGQTINHHYAQSIPQRKNLSIRNGSISSVNNVHGELSLRTSPFNKDPFDSNTNTSYMRSTKHFQNEPKQAETETWNDEELYNLSQENSKMSSLHEIIELENIEPIARNAPGEDSQEVDMNRYREHQKPSHKKGASSIYSQNTNDLNKLLYSQSRDSSNVVYSSYKFSEVMQSNQASFNEYLRKIRASEDQVSPNGFQNHWNMYNQERRFDNDGPQQVHYIGPIEAEERENTANSVDFQLTNSKVEDTDEEQYEGMNFDEYCKNATEVGAYIPQSDNRLSITDEQRESLMQRIMILKMQQSHSQLHEDENFELSNSEQHEYQDEQDFCDEAEGEYSQE